MMIADQEVGSKTKEGASCVLLSALQVNIDLGSTFAEVLTCPDVALYGSLCALAGFSRAQLSTLLQPASSFKEFLDQVPDVSAW